jgi:hypothetical protein
MRRLPGLLSLLIIAGCATQPAPAPTMAGTAATPVPAVSAAPADSSQAGSTQASARTKDEIEYGREGKKKDGTVVYCREQLVTNSRLRSQKICLTKEQWVARERNAREAWREEANRSALNPRGN